MALGLGARIAHFLGWKQAPVVAASGSPDMQTEHFGGPLGFGGSIRSKTTFDEIDRVLLALPLLDVGLRKYVRLCNGFRVKCANEATAQAINAWLDDQVRVNWVQVGFDSFSTRHLRSMLQYGNALGEMGLTGDGRDIHSLLNANSRQNRVRFQEGELQLGQQTRIGSTTWFENDEWLIYNVNAPEGDDPYGTSLFRSVPWLANAVLTMFDCTRRNWQRVGSPPQLIHAKLPDGSTKDMAETIERSIRNQWKKSQIDRFQNTGYRDFTLASNTELDVKTIGADMHDLPFQEPYRSMMEQLLSTEELPPFLLGIQWSTTERLSIAQARAISACVADVRSEVQPDYMRIAEAKQAFLRLRGQLEPDWEPVTLEDVVETARAEGMQAQALKTRTEAAISMWEQGFIDQLRAAQIATGVEDLAEVARVLEEPIRPAPRPAVGAPGALSHDGGNGKIARAARFAGYP